MENKINKGTTVAIAREVVEGKIGTEALSRAGYNKNLKGIIHEVAVKDIYNISPIRLVDGTKATLSKSPTAIRDDILIMKAGKVIGRQQLKDTANSVQKTLSQVKEGHYVGTTLKGTKETVAAYNAAVEKAVSNSTKVTQKMKSTGISSNDTARIATKTIGTKAGSISSKMVSNLALSSGATGGAISGGLEIISSGVKLASGEIDGTEFTENVVKETLGGALSAAGGSVAATFASAGTATLLATTTAPIWLPAAVGIGAAVAVGSGIKSFFNSLW